MFASFSLSDSLTDCFGGNLKCPAAVGKKALPLAPSFFPLLFPFPRVSHKQPLGLAEAVCLVISAARPHLIGPLHGAGSEH